MTDTTPAEPVEPPADTPADVDGTDVDGTDVDRTDVAAPTPPAPAHLSVAETDPYPPAARPSFDIPVSAPVSAHAPVVVQRVSAPGTGATATTHDGGEHESDHRGSHGTDERSSSGNHASPVARAPRRGRRAALIVLATLLVLALGAATYLAVLSNEWEQRSGEWETQSRELGSDVADLTGDIAGMTSELTTVRDQLATAQARITELADEKAQVGDDRESQKILADDVQEVAETALVVSAALGDCITAQNTVIGFLAAPETTTPEALQTAVTQSDTVCAAAVDDYNALQQDLAAS